VTGDRMSEFVARCRRDPVFFLDNMVSKKPHPGQISWLRDSIQPINVLVPGNRYGKSVAIAMKHIWKAWTKHGAPPDPTKTWRQLPYETISTSMSADQAEIVHREVRTLLSDPRIAPFVTSVRSTPFPSVKLWNGSVIHCRSAHDEGKYLDGHAYRYVSIDEAGWVPKLKALMNGVILMRLAGGGQVDLVGTPKGMGDLYWYADRGLRKVPGYYAQRGSSFDNPYLPLADLQMRDRLLEQADARLREQVIFGAFVDLAGLAFTQDQRENAFDPALPAHQDYVDGHRYVQAWDLGRRTDFTVGITLDVTVRPYPVVDYVRLNKVPWEQIYSLIRDRALDYRVAMPRIDATGPQGDVIEEELWKRHIPVDPFKTSTGAAKLDLINNLQSALDYGRKTVGWRIALDEAGIEHEVPVGAEPDPSSPDWGLLRLPCIPQLMDEMGTYQLDDKDLVQDSVMSLALVTELAYQGASLGKAVFGSLYGSDAA